MTTVHVDFNDLARGGKVVALRSWADGPVSVGDRVLAVDRFEDMRFSAVVAEENAETGEIYLAFDPDVADPKPAEHVIYSMDSAQQPVWIYRTLSGGSYGSGASLNEVRARYRSRRNPDDKGQIDVIEHVEVRHEPGYWLRHQLREDNLEGDYPARVFLATTKYEGVTRMDLSRWGLAGNGEPLVIACLPDDTIISVLDQITDYDTAVVTTTIGDPQRDGYVSGVSALSGSWASRTKARFQTLAESGLGVNSTILELMEHSGAHAALERKRKGKPRDILSSEHSRPARRKGDPPIIPSRILDRLHNQVAFIAA